MHRILPIAIASIAAAQIHTSDGAGFVRHNPATHISLASPDAAPPADFVHEGFRGEDGGPIAYSDRTFGVFADADPTVFPNRTACRVVSIFDDGNGGDVIVLSSGTLIDAEMLLTTGAAVYRREGTPGWARDIFVYPGWNNVGVISLGTGTFRHFGMARGTWYLTGSNWINNGDHSQNIGAVQLDRAVGMITGWLLYDANQSCQTDLSRTYESVGYPASCSLAGMMEWSYTFDDCSGTQRRFVSPDDCGQRLTYGYEGAGVRFDAGFISAVRGVFTRRTTDHRNHASMLFPAFGDEIAAFINDSRGSTFDLQALNTKTPYFAMLAGQPMGAMSFLAANATNANPPSATYTCRVYLSTDANISGADTLVGTRTFTWDFAPLGKRRVEITDLVAPTNLAPGDYYLGVILDSATDANSANNDTDDWDTAPVYMVGPANTNNLCASGLPLPLGIDIAGTNAGATPDGASFCGVDRLPVDDVWYSFVAPHTGRFTVQTVPGGTLTDTVISVHTGCPGDETNDLACDDNGGAGNLSFTSFPATRGGTYRIRVGGFNGTEGTFTLRADINPPTNDACFGAPFIGQGLHEGTTIGASPSAPACAGETGGDVFYTFMPSCQSKFLISLLGSDGMPASVLSIYRGCPDNGGVLVECATGTPAHPHAYTILEADNSSVYTIRVAAPTEADEGDFTLEVRAYPFTSEVYTCNSASIVVEGTVREFSTCGASVSSGNAPVPGCTLGLNNTVGPDQWFRWSSGNQREVAVASLCGSTFDTVAVVYEYNCPLAPSVIVGCSDNVCGDDAVVSWITTPGMDYMIRVGGATTNAFLINQSGQGQLTLTASPLCAWESNGCYADYNNDGGVDGDDVIAFFENWDTGRPCADVSLDGGVDGDDVILFFRSWDSGGVGAPGC